MFEDVTLFVTANCDVRSDKSSYLYTDNWYLRPSRSPSHSGSEQFRQSPVSVVAGPARTSITPARAETVAVSLPGRAPYERQISRVRSLSVFSSDSHIHPDTQPASTGDNISLDFDILEEEEDQVTVLVTDYQRLLTFISFQRQHNTRRIP